MAKIKDCPGFETFGVDVRAAREALGLTIKALAEQINVDPRYLSEIELKPTIPSIPVILQLVRICRLPMERYFNTLKNECVNLYGFRTEEELYQTVEEFAYVTYNHVRPHSYNGYKPPFEARCA